MAEKRGHTAKKLYDFNTSGVLEVCIKGNWYRTTCNDFRSFDGNRRITEPIKQPGIGDSFNDIELATEYFNEFTARLKFSQREQHSLFLQQVFNQLF